MVLLRATIDKGQGNLFKDQILVPGYKEEGVVKKNTKKGTRLGMGTGNENRDRKKILTNH